jgi:choline dehydrogenase-like flavoprotein
MESLTDFAADVIIVGAGSEGCALARRLVDRDVAVLLLEAGGPDENPAIHEPARVDELWLSPEDWGYYTVPRRARPAAGFTCPVAGCWAGRAVSTVWSTSAAPGRTMPNG